MSQRRMALKTFLECAGYKIFEEELQMYYDSSNNHVINKYSSSIGLDKLAGLNYDLGEKAGLGKALNILENFKTELREKSSNQTLTDNVVNES